MFSAYVYCYNIQNLNAYNAYKMNENKNLVLCVTSRQETDLRCCIGDTVENYNDLRASRENSRFSLLNIEKSGKENEKKRFKRTERLAKCRGKKTCYIRI